MNLGGLTMTEIYFSFSYFISEISGRGIMSWRKQKLENEEKRVQISGLSEKEKWTEYENCVTAIECLLMVAGVVILMRGILFPLIHGHLEKYPWTFIMCWKA